MSVTRSQFLGSEGTKPSHEVRYPDGLYLLKVESSGFEERLGDVQLPAVAFDRS